MRAKKRQFHSNIKRRWQHSSRHDVCIEQFLRERKRGRKKVLSAASSGENGEVTPQGAAVPRKWTGVQLAALSFQ